ncbi:ATPase, histidine kinase-, DNA gyrase B-, and HSP90-like domain protein [Planktothrix serta PCC 8927]|uniref:histidine kinase n=1 Tax=Planktothrix serta PCC 8927 TaxID=671068 RepID=A0A7Z9BJU1_9CYAN|nr:HAMP domain-containing sensor histidine kinase [Planktothrix serta]VXD13535.1 ATPase, histidine kinase-, DNA gyrase B-, and HSP90-like domain protein [Planktothrix serta PCC 8927]
MAWDIGSTRNAINPQFRALSWRLLLSYLGVMMAISGTSMIAVYEFFAFSLYQQLDRQLLTLADAATHNFEEIKEHKEASKVSDSLKLDDDEDLDIPWQNIQQPNQGIEWFDANRQLITKAGKVFPPLDLSHYHRTYTVNEKKIRTLTLEINKEPEATQQIMGYVRISESTEPIEMVLKKLRLGMMLGGILVSALTAFGGMWLTKQSLKPIEQSFEKLKQFTADASHELRNPLAGIRACVEVMQSHPERIHTADIDKLKAIASGVNQMTSLVEDLLLLARTDQHSLSITTNWLIIPLHELLEDLVEFLSFQAEQKQIELILDIKTNIKMKGDGNQLWRLFLNLIENAIYYTDTGGKVRVSLEDREKWVWVRIEDTGMGISAEQLPLIFDRLWRADQARTRQEGGSGLGLAIAQTLVQHHQGEITVTSELGKGSCFVVRFPNLPHL